MPLFLKELQGVTVCSRFGSNFIKQKIQVKNNHSVNQLQIDPAIKKIRTYGFADYISATQNEARLAVWNCKNKIDISREVSLPDDLSDSLYKGRILYSSQIEKAKFISYQLPTFVT